MRNYISKYYNNLNHKYNILFPSKRILERLGYQKETILLIIHADDLGLSKSENEASIEAMKHGVINSGSIMVNCPKFQDIADFAIAHPEIDFGIHFTLTSEWESYKWGPVLPPNEVASLVDDDGFFFNSHEKLNNNLIACDVEKELRAQIELALKSGINITHIDSHMFVAVSNPKIQDIYILLGKEYKLPVLLSYQRSIPINNIQSEILVNKIFIASPSDQNRGLDKYYHNVLKSIKPGLNCILVHPAFNNEEMQVIMKNELNYGAIWRQADFDYFTSDDCKRIIKNRNIQQITWKEIHENLFL